MAGDYIQVDHELSQKPEFLAIRGKTGEPADVVLGRLVLLWILADRQTTNGVIPLVTPATLGVALGGDAAFWEAVPDTWLKFSAAGAVIPDFDARFGRSARRRIKDAQAAKARRHAKPPTGARQEADAPPTEPRQEADARPVDDRPGPDAKPTEPRQEADRRPLSVSVSEPVSDPPPEPGKFDRVFSWTKEQREATLSLAQRKFRQKTAKGSSLFPKQLPPADRLLLIKTAALMVAGLLSEWAIDQGLQALRHARKPIPKPVAYFRQVLNEKTGGTYAALLDDVFVPADLTNPRKEPN
jgi:hypothetical protein